MIAIRGLAALAILGCSAIALAPHGAADPARETFSIAFRYDAGKPALDNYLSFARQAERVCSVTRGQRLVLRSVDRACVEDLLGKVVARMDRPQLAAIHDRITGVRIDSSRSLAAR
jgi:hypothetical protein